MQVVHTHCAGLDVHKKSVVACVIVPKDKRSWRKEIRTFTTMTADLKEMVTWLSRAQVTHVAMESTGEYWKPIFNILEGQFEVLLVNAHHLRAVPGRKTDVKDAEWIAELLQHGLLRGSFIPPAPQRALRELTRHRSNFVREHTNLVNRLHKTLESANIKLAAVTTKLVGVSGRAMLAAMLEGQTDPVLLAELAKGRLRTKHDLLVQALEGQVQAHHRFIISELLCQIDALDETIARFDYEIEAACAAHAENIGLLDTIPGVGPEIAQIILAEVGSDMSRFPSPQHLSAWAGVAPGNNESAGKKRSGKMRPGNRALRTALVQAAHAASRKKRCYFAALYHRLAARRGRKRAIMAVAHAILVCAYAMLQHHEPYRELGENYFDQLNPTALVNRLVRRIEKLGYKVSWEEPVLVLPT